MFKYIKLAKLNIIRAWQDALLSGFSDKTSYLSNPDPFLNPIGALIPKMLEILFDEITGDMDNDRIVSALGDFIKIRAVQDCAPSQALGFIFSLKNILNSGNISENQKISPHELKILEERIDNILLKSFDLYMKCRENIYTIRISEFKKKAFRALENIK